MPYPTVAVRFDEHIGVERRTLAMRQHNPNATSPSSRKLASTRLIEGTIKSLTTPSRVEFSSNLYTAIEFIRVPTIWA